MADMRNNLTGVASLQPFWPGCRGIGMRSTAGLAVLLAGIEPAIVSASGFEGEWCDVRGEERLLIDEHGLGFNEHTICEWTQMRPTADTFDTTALCANVYSDGKGGWVHMDETTVRLQADRSAPGVITVTVAGKQSVDFARCDR
ncbi:hypothetical protein RHAB21_00578 [Pseudorhizobium halotolerans]|uniref:Uncharacterized protein n=1 Tax=Pseudorhizobium halotolerans TaxID=1233081 RepID=A0ABN7JYT8_9HYPH|nr:hypothetical protein [Pseudorhizobium halotolerans]CAD7054638.1 hypothetical protein RHAB21_00578 [Pseudorhizobium halotolerans]